VKIIVTGGLGFIGSSVIKNLINKDNIQILNLDKSTYAANPEYLDFLKNNSKYKFQEGDIADKELIEKLLKNFQPEVIMNLAAETHVDRSINNPEKFIHTNILGTFNLLECTRRYLQSESIKGTENFKFHHISTDEVFGSLGETGLFDEASQYKPSSPYSASKASSDHLVRAWNHTFKIPTIVTNCSNNYGPNQYPEKLIPLTILNALQGKKIPIYGNGQQVRDWLYVDDHAEALYQIIQKGKIGETYNIGGNNEITNIELVKKICFIMDKKIKIKPFKIKSFVELISFVQDRPGHDYRYGIDASKLKNELNWEPTTNLDLGLLKTVDWYIKNNR
jgi:dTDP-glucose 4,6-dehydratase